MPIILLDLYEAFTWNFNIESASMRASKIYWQNSIFNLANNPLAFAMIRTSGGRLQAENYYSDTENHSAVRHVRDDY